MKKELNKKIISLCEEAGTSAAAQICGDLMDKLDREYDQHISEGKTELEAYREVSRRLDEIKQIVDSLPEDEEKETEEERLDRMAGFRTLKRITGKMSTVLWLSTVPVYLLYSMYTGRWATSWLIFILAAVSEVLINGTVDWNNEKKDRKKIARAIASSFLWLMTVVLYFVISFASGRWALTWMIFILAAIIQQFFGKN